MSFKKTILKECIASGKKENDEFSYEAVKEIADHILATSKHRPKVAIICGSGLGGIADTLVNSEVLPYESIPHFPVTSLPRHAGKLVLGILSGIPVVCFQGRIHYYEGHPLWKCALGVRVAKLMGITELIVTNSAGALNTNYKVGDIMILKDHINLMNLGGCSPLRGKNDPRFGPQYPSMNNAYDRKLREKARKFVTEGGMGDIVKEGVYAIVSGPMFETPSEIRALKILGADAVGMSTVPEVIVARHCGVRVFSFSLISNVTNADDDQHSLEDNIQNIGNTREKEVTELVTHMVIQMASSSASS